MLIKRRFAFFPLGISTLIATCQINNSIWQGALVAPKSRMPTYIRRSLTQRTLNPKTAEGATNLPHLRVTSPLTSPLEAVATNQIAAETLHRSANQLSCTPFGSDRESTNQKSFEMFRVHKPIRMNYRPCPLALDQSNGGIHPGWI